MWGRSFALGFTQSLCVRPHDLMLVVHLLHKSIYIPSWRTYREHQLSSWGMHTVTIGCTTGFEERLLSSDLLPLCKRLATILTSKSDTKWHFKDFMMARQGLYVSTVSANLGSPIAFTFLSSYLSLYTFPASLTWHFRQVEWTRPSCIFFSRSTQLSLTLLG